MTHTRFVEGTETFRVRVAGEDVVLVGLENYERWQTMAREQGRTFELVSRTDASGKTWAQVEREG